MEAFRHHNHHHGADQSFSVEFGPTYDQVRNAKRKARARPSKVRIMIRGITLIVGASILGVLAHSAAVWYTTRNDILEQPDGFRMPGWPAQMDLLPTWVMLGAATIAIIIQIISLLTLVGNVSSSSASQSQGQQLTQRFQVRRLRESQLHTWVVWFTSLAAIAAWIAAAAYFKSQDAMGQRNWTLWSWSCSHENLVNGKMSFKAMCVKLVCSPLHDLDANR